MSSSAPSRGHTLRLPLFNPLPPRGSEDANASKRKRSSKPKVRSGCLTCKKRHVKCDERKPTCYRCEKADIECSGYAVPKPPETKKPKDVVRPVRPLLPRRSESPSSPPVDNFVPAFLVVPESSMFEGSVANYLDLFQQHEPEDLGSPDFWSRIVSCESLSDRCVYYSMLAINALSEALSLSHELSNMYHSQQHHHHNHRHSPSGLSIDEHHKTALNHHTMAVSMFRERIASQDGTTSCRTILVTTLLFVAYELLQGNIETADSLAVKGVMLLRDRQGSYSPPVCAISLLGRRKTVRLTRLGHGDGPHASRSALVRSHERLEPLRSWLSAEGREFLIAENSLHRLSLAALPPRHGRWSISPSLASMPSSDTE